METYPKCLHVVLYYDDEVARADGMGWSVEFSDSETTTRFGTLASALAYIERFETTIKAGNGLVI